MADSTEAVSRKRRHDDDTQQLDPPPELLERTRRHVPEQVMYLGSGAVSSAGVTHAREPDEDSVLVLEMRRVLEGMPEWFGFYAVADGMGGQSAGEVASRLALQALAVSLMDRVGRLWLQEARLEPQDVRARLRECVEDAHQRVQICNQEVQRDMGTTLAACLLLDQNLYVVNVGDSRVYRWQGHARQLARISRDQSLVQQLVEAGEITADDVYTDPRRNIILSSLGGDSVETGVEISMDEVADGDRILVCSDGLWEMVRDPDLQAILERDGSPQQCAEALVTRACANGGNDNVSAVVIELQTRPRQ